jgi:hypothetical protein
VKIRSIKKHYEKFVRLRFLAKGEPSYITGTIIELSKDYLRLNVNDEGTKAKVYYDKILRIFELERRSMNENNNIEG